MKSLLLLCVLCLSTSIADAETSDFDADAAYRTKRFGSLGIGLPLLYFSLTQEETGASYLTGSSYLSIEGGKGGRSPSGALVLHAATLETPPARIGYSVRYFPARPSQRLFYLGKLGVGIYRALDEFGLYQNRPHLNVGGGLGYQWHRHSAVEFALSYAHSPGGWGVGNGISIVVIGRGILW